MNGKFTIIIAMIIYGSLGVFVKRIDLPPIIIAFLRACIGSLFLVFAGFFVKKKYCLKSLKQNIKLLIISGTALGINWTFLFESFKYISVSNSILVYYFAPVIVIILSPIVLKEKLNISKVLCVIISMMGIFLIVKSDMSTLQNSKEYLKGIVYSLLAALFYSSVILMNKRIKNLSGFETTVVQLISSAITLLPIIFFNNNTGILKLTPRSLVLILILGIVHTGIAYLLYFSSMKKLKGQSIAIFCYIDPISAMFFATIFLGENITISQLIGGALILGSTFLNSRKEAIEEGENDGY